jgi:hypothetical protein
MEEKNPKVFISYSHDSKEHQDRVLDFSNKLRSEGIDCTLDQYEDSPPEGWPKWMDRNIRTSDYVLVVCTDSYYKKVMGDENGKGIQWESSIIYQHLYNAGANNKKFIPVLFKNGEFEHIPEPLQGASYYNIEDKDAYNKLYWRLRSVKTEKPELGKLRELPQKERRTLFVSDLIDQEKWQQANWQNGVAYLYSSNGDLPPVFTVLFENIEIGKEIFKELIEKIGAVDETERLRISIVEGDVPNQDLGYFVVIGENIEATNQVIDKHKQDNSVHYVAISNRIHRMKPKKNSKNLINFKKEFEKHKCYHIAPARQIQHPEKGTGYAIEMDYKILKRKIDFRNYADIQTCNDPDSILKSEDLISHKF